MEFWDFSIWDISIQFGIICIILLFANILLKKIPFLRKSLLPAAVIGGFLALFLRSVGWLPFVNESLLNAITYHSLAIGFIALSLKRSYGVDKNSLGAKQKKIGAYRTGLTIVGTYLVQGVVGLGITLFIGGLISPAIFKAAGLLLPLGFGQGPGQANNFGTIYEKIHGFIGGQSFGLGIASVGFIVACLVFVIWVNVKKKKHGLVLRTEKTGKELNDSINPEDEVPLSDAVDKFTLQIGIVALIFVITFLFMWGFDKLLIENGVLGNFGVNTVRPLLWGFNFIFGSLFAMLFKKIFCFAKKKKWVEKEYCNNYIMNRISGSVFDFMIIASICLINVNAMKSLWWLLLIVCVSGAIVTYFYLDYVCKKRFKGYSNEQFAVLLGNLTGTASTGVALLRVIDPNFETPASSNLISGSAVAIVFGFPLMLLLGLAPTQPLLTLILLIVFFIIINFLLFYNKKRKSNIDLSQLNDQSILVDSEIIDTAELVDSEIIETENITANTNN